MSPMISQHRSRAEAPAGRWRRQAAAAGAGAALLALTRRRLLPRMRAELLTEGALRDATARRMWAGYCALAALDTAALVTAPSRRPANRPLRTASAALAGAGLVVSARSMGAFQSVRQVNAMEAGQLVTGGMYRVSRNPQYAGFVALLTGLAGARRSPAAGVLAAGTGVLLDGWIRTEEEHLAQHFGADYVAYSARVRRWVGTADPQKWVCPMEPS